MVVRETQTRHPDDEKSEEEGWHMGEGDEIQKPRRGVAVSPGINPGANLRSMES